MTVISVVGVAVVPVAVVSVSVAVVAVVRVALPVVPVTVVVTVTVAVSVRLSFGLGLPLAVVAVVPGAVVAMHHVGPLQPVGVVRLGLGLHSGHGGKGHEQQCLQLQNCTL